MLYDNAASSSGKQESDVAAAAATACLDAELFDVLQRNPSALVTSSPVDASRPRSWSPEDSTTKLLLKTQDFGE